MIKRIMIVLLMAIILFSSSCSKIDTSTDNQNDSTEFSIGESMSEFIKGNSEEELIDALLEEIFTIIKNEDKEAMKNLFSKQVFGDLEDFDNDFDYLINFFQGDIKAWQKIVVSTDLSIRNGKKTVELHAWYTVETDIDKYTFLIINFPEDTINPDNQGMYALMVIKTENEEEEFTYWQDMEPGIYKSEE